MLRHSSNKSAQSGAACPVSPQLTITLNLLASSSFARSFRSSLATLPALSSAVSLGSNPISLLLSLSASLSFSRFVPSSTLAITSLSSRTDWPYAAIAAGTLLAESSNTADWARCNAMVRTDLEEVGPPAAEEEVLVRFGLEVDGRVGEERSESVGEVASANRPSAGLDR